MKKSKKPAVSQIEAEDAVRTLLEWAGEDPSREGLLDTPKRVTRGVHKRGVSMITSQMLGTFREDARTRAEFLRFIDIDAGRRV